MEQDKNAQLEQRLKDFRTRSRSEDEILHEVNAHELLTFFLNELDNVKEGETHYFFVKDPYHLSSWAQDIQMGLCTREYEPGQVFILERRGEVYEMWAGPRVTAGSANVSFRKEDVRLDWTESAPAGNRTIHISKGGQLSPTAKTYFGIEFTYWNWNPEKDPIPAGDPLRIMVTDAMIKRARMRDFMNAYNASDRINFYCRNFVLPKYAEVHVENGPTVQLTDMFSELGIPEERIKEVLEFGDLAKMYPGSCHEKRQNPVDFSGHFTEGGKQRLADMLGKTIIYYKEEGGDPPCIHSPEIYEPREEN
ncbi:hypothetical protein GF371_04915 [Candidatus Woesearchaeota archaeon]|nr:hypothetical protein [Candidatus Woesearchaeota archaeon]